VWAGSRKGSGAWGYGRKMHGRGLVHDGEHGRFGVDGSYGRGPGNREGADERTCFCADEQGPWINERRRVCADEFGADKSTPPDSEREREERAGARRH
jgi:hypothetical protein